jgi:hypothetical protein
MTTTDRTAGLRAARTQDSHDKRRRALTAINALEAAGTPITAAAVARAAGVSTWLLYTDGVREHLDAARRRQAQTSSGPPRAVAPTDQAPLTPASLRTDLALARAEISRLRAEHDNSATGYASNSAPRSTDQTAPNSSPASPTLNHSPANYSPNATPAPPKPTSHSDASGNSKTT